MRKSLLALGLVLAGMQGIAQHSHSYNRTVFNDAAAAGRPLEQGLLENHRSNVQRNFPGWMLNLDRQSGTVNDIYGPAVHVPGGTNEARARFVLDNYLTQLGIDKNNWHKVRDIEAPKAAYVDFEQVIDNHKVLFARLSFRFTKDGRLVRVKNNYYGNKPASANVSLTKQDVQQGNAILDDTHGLVVSSNKVSGDWVWFPVPSDNGGYELHPAWHVTVEAKEESGHPAILDGYVDATDGKLLYRTNEVTDADVQVKGEVYKYNTSIPATMEPLPNLQAVVNNGPVTHTDANGNITDASPSMTVDFELKGLWATVDISGTGTPGFTDVFTGTGNVYTFPATGASNNRAVNAYYHVNVVHDFMKSYWPTFTDFDFSLETNVDVPGTCNAFYTNGNANTPSTINFYAAGGGCKSFAEIADVVYHEYGHGISYKFYSANGATFRNGALGEANSDIWGISILKDSVIGRNAYTGGGFIRRYDVNHKVYPQDHVGQVHGDGEIVAGAWWDVAKNMNSYEAMTQLFTDTYYDLPNGPNGTEGAVFHDVLISAIMNDDDDNDLSNGTPHFNEIVAAFAKHGIYLLGDAVFTHTELAHQTAGAPINVSTTLTLANPAFFKDLKLIYKVRTNTVWDTLVMTNTGGNNYATTIPGQPMSTLVDYYFYVNDFLDMPAAVYPYNFRTDLSQLSKSNIPLQFGIGIHAVSKTTFEDPADDWTKGLTTDNASGTGVWVQAKPIGTSSQGLPVQTGADHTTGSGQCMVTGNSTSTSSNSADVDNGKTTLLTPAMNLTGMVFPIIEYYRWFSNDRGENRKNDYWQVQIKSGGAWSTVEYTNQADASWRRRIFSLYQYTPGNENVQLQFIASDNITNGSGDGQSTVEAAIDDFFIYDGVPLSANDIKPERAQIYPNPADNMVKILLPQAKEGTISIADVTGRVLSVVNLTKADTYTLSTSELPSGVYMIMINTKNTVQSQKLVVNH